MQLSDIEAILPQTQCGLCGFAGCKPYAEALLAKEVSINLCPPGGVPGLTKLGEILNIDPTPYIPEMVLSAKPFTIAFIRESECIGCMKCIQACPVDAIIGSAKLMHTVLSDECTGCGLCVAPCPVDCIEMVSAEPPALDKNLHFKQRFQAKELRAELASPNPTPIDDKSAYLKAALLRAQQKANID
jgi:electron transport complex protein RnfB